MTTRSGSGEERAMELPQPGGTIALNGKEYTIRDVEISARGLQRSSDPDDIRAH